MSESPAENNKPAEPSAADKTTNYLDDLGRRAFEYFTHHEEDKKILSTKKGEDPSLPNSCAYTKYLQDKPDLQQKVADLVNFSPSQWLLEQEMPVLAVRRKIHCERQKRPRKGSACESARRAQPQITFDPCQKKKKDGDGVYECARKSELQGICFSGGGIRSATFNLGVLQGLARLEMLNRFDYLSSVSGGGYIHEWFAAWVSREERELARREQERVARKKQDGESRPTLDTPAPPPVPAPRVTGKGFEDVEEKLEPLPSTSGYPMHPEPIRWLRRYSNYLTPQMGLFTADTWVAFSIWFRNTFLNQLILVSFLFLLLLIPNFAGPCIVNASGLWSVVVAGVFFVFSVLYASRELHREYERTRALDKKTEDEEKEIAENKGGGEITILAGVIAPLFAASVLHLGAVTSESRLNPWLEYGMQFLLLWFFIVAIAFAGASTATYIELHKILGANQTGWRRYWRSFLVAVNGVGFLVLVNAAISASAGVLLFVGVRRALEWRLPANISHMLGSPEMWRFQVTFGPPLLFGIPFFALVIGAGLVGRDFPDWLREWLARVRAWSLLVAFGWIGFFGIALLGPYVIWHSQPQGLFSAKIKFSGVMAWLFTTAGSVLAGNSNKTSGKAGEAASRSAALDLLARVGPHIFVLGLLLMLSVAVQSSFDYVAGLGSCWVMVLLLFIPLAIFLLFGWRVDVNEFSMNPFYRNRLTRCYLGASNKKRAPNPLTGFDDRDTRLMQISRLRPPEPPKDEVKKTGGRENGGPENDEAKKAPSETTTEEPRTYTGPYPIICAAINLSFGEDLAWQERKAASFAFTPLYSGYHVGWTEGKHGCKLSFNGYVPTCHYACPNGGINIATAVSISGAAASPNWGYHTNPATAFLMTMFNVRLGWWLFNPRRSKLAGARCSEEPKQREWASPLFSPLMLTAELLGRATDTSRYVYLSDGGHFDNMGLYELVRRRCYRIVICDAEEDENYFFEGIANAIRKCRIDFGAEITLDLSQLRLVEKTGNCESHWAKGTIRYPETPAGEDNEGTVLYIKSSLTGAAQYIERAKKKDAVEQPDKPTLLPIEPLDVINYKFTHEHFPHDSTANQWFTESQFESYRRLGYHVISEVNQCKQWDEFLGASAASVAGTGTAGQSGRKLNL